MTRDMQISTLSNGIRAISIPASGPVCHCALVVGAGARDEADDEHGLAHFVEHTIFKGTRKRTAHQILNRLDEVGGEINAYTTKDETAVHASFLQEDFNRAAELIADILFNPTFPKKEIDKERDVIIDEITSYQDSPSELIFDEFEDLAFAGTPLGHNILGDASSVARFSAADAEGFVRRAHTTDRMAFVFVGPLPPIRVVAVAERHFGGRPATRRAAGGGRGVDVFGLFDKTVERDTRQGHVVLGFRAPDCHSDDRLSMAVIARLLGGPSMNSRLSVALRERRGIAYNVETDYTPFDDTGLFTIYFGTDPQNIPVSMDVVARELDRLCQAPMSQAAFARVLRQYVGQRLIEADDGESVMLAAARAVIFHGRALTLAEAAEEVRRTVTPESVMRVAREVLGGGKMSRLIYC